jgi:hypothetical protein
VVAGSETFPGTDRRQRWVERLLAPYRVLFLVFGEETDARDPVEEDEERLDAFLAGDRRALEDVRRLRASRAEDAADRLAEGG